jgi:hypothetical protein
MNKQKLQKYTGRCSETILIFSIVIALYGNITLKEFLEKQQSDSPLIIIHNK